jgi:catechol 2,3-dioxygenase-like lactoylglutathione lyase family enzyme
MIAALDHIVLAVGDLAAAETTYTLLLGRAPSWRSINTEQGTANVVYRLANMSLELLAPAGAGPVGARLQDYLSASGDHLASLAFNAPDLARAHHRFANLGLSPSDMAPGRSVDRKTGRVRNWGAFRAMSNTHGVRVFVVDEASGSPVFPFAKSESGESAAIAGLDHVVIRTPDPERAAALYGARLGLDMRLDQSNPDWGARLMFFRCGDLIVEIAHDLNAGVGAGPDALWGLSWRLADAEAAHMRLSQAGLDVSPVRTGRKPGTRVFTVRAGTCGVPTLCVQPAAAR